jgi:hypothetical protein
MDGTGMEAAEVGVEVCGLSASAALAFGALDVFDLALPFKVSGIGSTGSVGVAGFEGSARVTGVCSMVPPLVGIVGTEITLGSAEDTEDEEAGVGFLLSESSSAGKRRGTLRSFRCPLASTSYDMGGMTGPDLDLVTAGVNVKV